MPDMIPAAASAQPYNPMQGVGMLSSILGIKQQQQQLQTGQYAQQAEQATAQQQQVAAQAAQGTNQFFSQWAPGDHIAPDGTTDIESAHQSDAYRNIPGVARLAVDQKLLDLKKGQIDNMQTMATMDNNTINDLARRSNTLSTDDDVKADNQAGRDKVAGMFQNYGKLGPEQAKIVSIFGKIADVAPKGNLSTAMASLGAQAQTVSEQQAQSNPAQLAVNTGGATQLYNVKKATGLQPGQQPVAAIPNTLPPQVIQQPITNAPAVVGGAAGTTPRPIGGSGWQPYAGQGQDVQNFQSEVQNTRTAADQAPLAHNINQQILRLADNSKTGPGTEVWQHAVGALGAPLGLSPTANYQELGKFLEKNAINNMQSMGGPPSDARLSAAAAANGSTNFSPEALKAVTKFNDATTTGLQQYRQAIDNSVGMGQGVDYTKLPAVKAAWAKNFDVNVFRVENAIRDGDTQELSKIKDELGPKGLQQLAAKRQNLNALTQGQIPQ